MKVARIHYKITCLRLDAIHKATTEIVLNNSFIALEDLNIKGMVKNHKLAKAVSDASMSEFNRQVEYKSAIYGSVIHRVDRWFPSTKLCINCGQLHDMPLNKRIFKCNCGVEEDRDIHAAQTILTEALREVAA